MFQGLFADNCACGRGVFEAGVPPDLRWFGWVVVRPSAALKTGCFAKQECSAAFGGYIGCTSPSGAVLCCLAPECARLSVAPLMSEYKLHASCSNSKSNYAVLLDEDVGPTATDRLYVPCGPAICGTAADACCRAGFYEFLYSLIT